MLFLCVYHKFMFICSNVITIVKGCGFTYELFSKQQKRFLFIVKNPAAETAGCQIYYSLLTFYNI
jgi:hypothetical protein